MSCDAIPPLPPLPSPPGNLASSSAQGTYSYGSTNYANPHAATSIGTSTATTLAYDNNGNLASTTRGSNDERYGWDYKNELTSVATGTATTTFGYDFTGNPVGLRSTGSGTTTYANQYFNKQNGTTTKHIFVNGEVVATIVGSGNSTSTLHRSYRPPDGDGSRHELEWGSGGDDGLLPYGDQRLDIQIGGVNEQRKFTGHEYDAAPG